MVAPASRWRKCIAVYRTGSKLRPARWPLVAAAWAGARWWRVSSTLRDLARARIRTALSEEWRPCEGPMPLVVKRLSSSTWS